MLETVREYGLEQLAASGELEATRDRHAAHLLAVTEAADPRLFHPGQEDVLEQLEAEAPNLRAALDRYEATEAVGPAVLLAGALRWFWLVRGDYREGTDRLRRALALSGAEATAPAARARALTGLGFLESMRGQDERAEASLTEALRLATTAGDAHEVGWARHGLGITAEYRGDYSSAEDHYAAALAVFGELASERPAERPRVADVLAEMGLVDLRPGGP
jgi:tetratricopeptide (TPR) repeat protein